MDNENKNNSIFGKKILIVEDDVFLNTLLAKKLLEMGALIYSAKDMDKMFEILKKEKIDVVSLDILLPEMNGFEALKKIKEDPTTKDIPVIILSNLGQKNDVDMGIKLGAKKFLIKALYSMDDLAEQFAEILK